MMPSIKEQLSKKIEKIEQTIDFYLPEEKGLQKTVLSAMNYSVKAGGKRLRPMLMAETYEMFGGADSSVIEPFMAAIEMIHTYSLIHDDLPALDNDALRRGMPTAHIKFGEAMAILAGDALLNYAFETAAKAFALTDRADLVGKAISILANKAGIYGMIGGQSVDVEYTDRPVTKSQLEFIYELKTAALLEAAMMIGAVLAGADDNQVKAAEQIAHHVGMAFQIRDDILDVISTTEELGKPVKSDEKNNKTTYVTIYGLDGASKLVEEYSHTAMTLLDQVCPNASFLKRLFEYLIVRKK